MIVQPGLCDNWKFKYLKQQIGNCAAEVLIRLWGHLQERKTDEVEGNPIKLAMVCDWQGNPGDLLAALELSTFVERREDGKLIARGFKEHNTQLFTRWENGVHGGRKSKKNEQKPDDNRTETETDSRLTEQKPDENRTETENDSRLSEQKPDENRTETENDSRLSEQKPDENRTETENDSRLSDKIRVDKNNNNMAICNRPSPAPSPEKSALEDAATAIYAEYPRKVHRPEALTAIRKAIKAEMVGVKGVTVASAAESLLAKCRPHFRQFRAQCDAGNSTYVPHAATFFNRKRFQDLVGESVDNAEQEGVYDIDAIIAGLKPASQEVGND